jgi:DNA-binding SARP family transcriptional activator
VPLGDGPAADEVRHVDRALWTARPGRWTMAHRELMHELQRMEGQGRRRLLLAADPLGRPEGGHRRGARPGRGHRLAAPPERAVVTELACYLALHQDRPASGEQLRAAIRPDDDHEPSAKTIRTYLSLLRKAIGADYLPSGGSSGYRLSWLVTSDWEGFNQMSAKDNGLAARLYASELIRGRPFDGVSSGTYGWVFSEFWISQIEATIASVAFAVATECLESRLLEQTLRALHQGLLAAPCDVSLWELRIRVAAAIGPTELARARSEAAASLDADLLSSLGKLSDP